MADLPEDKKTPEQSNLGATEDQTVETSVEEEKTPVGDSAAGKAADDQTTVEDEKVEPKDRDARRHERYIDRLGGEIRQSNERSNQSPEELFSTKPYQPLEIKDGDTLDPSQIEEDRKALGASKFAEGIRTGITQGSTQAQREIWADRFEADSERVTGKYAELDPDRPEEYNPELEAHLVQQYIAFTGMEKDAQGRVSIQKPNIRFKDFVEAEMMNLEKFASHKGATSSKNISSQAARTGMRPTGTSRPSTGGHGFDENDPVNSVHRMTRKQYFELGGKEASDAYLEKRGLAPKK